MDDVVIHSQDWETHLEKVEYEKAGLTTNPSKDAIGLVEAKNLWYIMGRGVVKPQLNKIEGDTKLAFINQEETGQSISGDSGVLQAVHSPSGQELAFCCVHSPPEHTV